MPQLPGYNRGAVQSLTPESTAAQESSLASSNIQTTQAFGQVADRAINSILDSRDTVEELKAKKALSNTRNQVDEILANGDIPTSLLDEKGIDYSDLKQDVSMVDGSSTGTIKNYKVRERVYDALMNETLNNAAEGFSDSRLKKQFLLKGQTDIDTGIAQQVVKSVEDSRQAQIDEAKVLMAESIDALDYETFISAISYLPPGADRDAAEREGVRLIKTGQIMQILDKDIYDPNRLSTLEDILPAMDDDHKNGAPLGSDYVQLRDQVVRAKYFQEAWEVFQEGHLTQGKWREDYEKQVLGQKNGARREEYTKALNLIPSKPRGSAATAELFTLFRGEIADLYKGGTEFQRTGVTDGPNDWRRLQTEADQLGNRIRAEAVRLGFELDKTQLKEIDDTIMYAVTAQPPTVTPTYIKNFTMGLSVQLPSEQLQTIDTLVVSGEINRMVPSDKEKLYAVKREAEDALKNRRETYTKTVIENPRLSAAWGWNVSTKGMSGSKASAETIKANQAKDLILKATQGLLDSDAFRQSTAEEMARAQKIVVDIFTGSLKRKGRLSGTREQTMKEFYEDLDEDWQRQVFADSLYDGFRGYTNLNGATRIPNIIRNAFAAANDKTNKPKPISVIGLEPETYMGVEVKN